MCAQTCEVIYVDISLSGRAYGKGVFLQLHIFLNNAAQLYGQKRKAVRRLAYLWFEAGGLRRSKYLLCLILEGFCSIRMVQALGG